MNEKVLGDVKECQVGWDIKEGGWRTNRKSGAVDSKKPKKRQKCGEKSRLLIFGYQ